MLKEILTEELGISNKVSLLTLRIKNLISNNFAKYKNDDNYRFNLPIFGTKISIENVYGNSLKLNFEHDELSVLFFIVDKTNEKYNVYMSKYRSEYDANKNQINLFLSSLDNKIIWCINDSTLQHEVEHYYQTYMKGKPLLTKKEMEKYKNFTDMFKNGDMYQKLISGVFHLYTKVEQNAIMNGLYREIMETNKISYVSKPFEILQNYKYYILINNLKHIFNEVNNDEMMKDFVSEELQKINKTYDSFVKIANITFSEYTKKFARTIYKANKDLEKKYNKTIK